MTEVEGSNLIVFKILKTFYVDPPLLFGKQQYGNQVLSKLLNCVHHTALS